MIPGSGNIEDTDRSGGKVPARARAYANNLTGSALTATASIHCLRNFDRFP
jgi:hypothetical protein